MPLVIESTADESFAFASSIASSIAADRPVVFCYIFDILVLIVLISAVIPEIFVFTISRDVVNSAIFEDINSDNVFKRAVIPASRVETVLPIY
jgi:hypothetical protein